MAGKKGSTFAFLSFCFIAYMQTGVNTIVQTLINAFPGISADTARLTVTFPCLSSLITSLVTGMLVGKKANYKTTYILACGFFAVGGLMPIFLNDRFIYILISRLIFGAGTGLALSYNAFALAGYPPESRAKMMGWALFMCNIGGVAGQLTAGALAEIHWRYAFLIYLTAPVVLIILALFLIEPPHTTHVAAEQKEEKGKKKFSISVIIYVFLGVMGGLWTGPINSGLSTFIAEHGFGSSMISGVILSVYTLAGAAGGALLDSVKKLGKYAAGASLLLVSIGFLLIVRSQSLVTVGLGTVFCGFGYMISKPLYTISLNRELSAGSMTLVSTLLLSSANLGIFISNAWIRVSDQLFGEIPVGEIDRSFYGGAVMFGISGLFLLVYHGLRFKNEALPEVRAEVD